ncbi:MAG TPA: imidazole glycerol phosphate synthase subunit HisH [Candidatus Acidoferrales bacterium]|nr:imidazole glycerol phosphate synthase subunit HisH [Candidatus Acidoferrales bacterium]
MRVTLFDYGAGNLHSLAKALAADGVTLVITSDPFAALDTDAVVLPGVGAFAPAAAALAPARPRWRDAVQAGLPCIGICLGLQLLLDASEEGVGEGLGLVAGRVRALSTRRRPHMGWNALEGALEPALEAAGLREAYFAHSFVVQPEDARAVTAWTVHERERVPAIVRSGSALGVQFHPEKSGRAGVAFLQSVLAGALARSGMSERA